MFFTKRLTFELVGSIEKRAQTNTLYRLTTGLSKTDRPIKVTPIVDLGIRVSVNDVI